MGFGPLGVNVQLGVYGDRIRGAAAGRDSKMKLWDVVAVCLVLLHTASAFPLPAGKRLLEAPAEDHSLGHRRVPFALTSDSNMPEDYPDQFDDVMDFIQATIKRLKRSPDKLVAALPRRERNRQAAAASPENSRGKGRRGGQRGKNRGCVLTAIHLNVTDLGLGYETKEELIFRYCSGSCEAAETMYDKILKNLSRSRRLTNDKVGQACCRPVAFDDDLSFLDDNLVYHILRKHSAKRCGCI
ncbi:glial cell line-derived neurotrophic factor [Grammomys surdaster]|uniref:glial cell line-derived neurotrophic factor n=1 Tax=Grammomys surdaster TaxID=491861 RepID=UPI00109F27C7|nr:glial cell line-derived neurotrophic factor [Grammomys surdaster]